jgi:ABC-2 type transport system permease protein
MTALDPSRLMTIARKEIVQIRRDPRSLYLAFIMPVLLLLLFGYAITWDVTHITLAYVDQDHSQRSRELLDAFRASGRFRLVAASERAADIVPLLERSRVQIAVVVPPDFAERLDGGRTAPLQAIVDGSDANTATIVLNYAQATVQSWALRALAQGPRRLPVVAESRVWYNEELLSRNMVVPGLVSVIMMVIGTVLTSLTIAREWERGTMEQLIATPVTPLEVVLGKLLPYLAIGLVDVAVTSLLGVVLFHVPFRGSALYLMVAGLAFLTGSLGIGLFISAATRSQLLSTQVAMLATFLPGVLLSGFLFALDTMPLPLRALSYLVPARYYLVVTRGIFLKGVGAEVLWVQGVFMLVFAAVGLALAARAFRKELA